MFCFRCQVPIDVLRIFYAWAQLEVSEGGGGEVKLQLIFVFLMHWVNHEVLAEWGRAFGKFCVNFYFRCNREGGGI